MTGLRYSGLLSSSFARFLKQVLEPYEATAENFYEN